MFTVKAAFSIIAFGCEENDQISLLNINQLTLRDQSGCMKGRAKLPDSDGKG